MSWQHLDEDSVRVRPGPGSRRRTRDRPAYEDGVLGRVVTVDRGRFTCLVDGVEVVAMRGGELRRTPVVVGDDVLLVGDVSGAPGGLARIVALQPRRTLLRRSADDTDPVERPIVANADQLVMVVALADPPPRPRFVDRCLVAAYDAGIEPLLCLTKTDLAAPDDLLAAYRPLGVRAVTTRPGDLGDLPEALRDRTSVLVGHSGVGKSTLVNVLVPDAQRRIGAVTALGRGRHTSVTAVALPLPGGGWVVDTPGVRSFGLGHVTVASLLAAFPDLAPAAEQCLPNCDHGAGTEGCRIAEGGVDPARLASYRRLLAARQGTPDD